MNICFVHDVLYPTYGGCGETAKRYIEKLNERGHKIVVLTSRKKGQKSYENYDGIIIYRFRGHDLPLTKKRAKVAYSSKRKITPILLKEKIDIIQIQNIQNRFSFLTQSALKASKKINIPIVMGFHFQPENITKNIKFLDSGSVNDLLYKIVTKRYSKSDAVIAPSRFAASLLSRFQSGLKISIVSNGIDLKKFSIKKKNNLKKAFKNKKIILYVGRLNKDKNIKALIESMPLILRSNKDAVIYLVGDGQDKKKLTKQIKKLNLDYSVFFGGRLSDQKLIDAYNSSDLFVLPSKVELQGMVILEAMACGKPVVVSKCESSAASELVEEGQNGYTFDPDDPGELAEKIIEVLSNNNLRKNMGLKSRELAEKHDIEKCINKTEKIYSDLMMI